MPCNSTDLIPEFGYSRRGPAPTLATPYGLTFRLAGALLRRRDWRSFRRQEGFIRWPTLLACERDRDECGLPAEEGGWSGGLG